MAQVIGYDKKGVLLDMDDNKRTIEAKCFFEDAELSTEDISLLFPKGVTRAVWEWQHLGQFYRCRDR